MRDLSWHPARGGLSREPRVAPSSWVPPSVLPHCPGLLRLGGELGTAGIPSFKLR